MSDMKAALVAAVSFPDRIVEQARNCPDAPALLWNGESISYGGLLKMVQDSRSDLERFAVPRQGCVAILAKKSPQTIALILACLLDRCSILLPSVGLSDQTLESLFDQASCGHVLSLSVPSRTAVAQLTCKVMNAAAADARFQSASCDAEETSLMLTTSGSTGVPKIVPLSLSAIDRFIAWAGSCFSITSGTTVLSYAPLNFDLCLLDIWTTLQHGGCVVLVDQDRATNARYLMDLLITGGVHLIQSVPMLYQLLIDATQDGRHRLESVLQVIVTGDSIPQRTLEVLPGLFPRARFYNVYGSTETNDSFIYEIDMSRDVARGNIPIGQAIEGVSALVVADGCRVITGSGSGELWVATPFQTRGYLTEELNEHKFVLCRAGTSQKTYFRTGDIVHRHDDDSITLEGRTDSYIKVRGVRISTQAVEQAILEHDQVREAAVIAIPDDLAGNRLHAVVRQDDTDQLNSLSLRQHCARKLDRSAIPSTIAIVTSALPRTSTGKIDRQHDLFKQLKRRKTDD